MWRGTAGEHEMSLPVTHPYFNVHQLYQVQSVTISTMPHPCSTLPHPQFHSAPVVNGAISNTPCSTMPYLIPHPLFHYAIPYTTPTMPYFIPHPLCHTLYHTPCSTVIPYTTPLVPLCHVELDTAVDDS